MSNEFYVDLIDKIDSGINFARESIDNLKNGDPDEDDVRSLTQTFNLIETYFSAIDRNLKDFYSAAKEEELEYEETPFEIFEGLTEQYFDVRDEFADLIREVQKNSMAGAMSNFGGQGDGGSDVIDFSGPDAPGPSGGGPGSGL